MPTPNLAPNLKNHVFDIAVVGGGLGGLAAALSLAETGAEIALIDQAPKNSPTSDLIRTTTINPVCFAHLKYLLKDSDVRMTPVKKICISDEGSSDEKDPLMTPLMTWHSDENSDGQSDASPLAYVFRNAEMLSALQSRAESHPAIQIYQGFSAEDYAPQHPRYGTAAAALYLKSPKAMKQNILAARLIAAADGRHSPLRRIAKIRTHTGPAPSGQSRQAAIIADIQTTRPHENIAWQCFIKGGPVALMPLEDACRMALVWTMKSTDADAAMTLDDTAFAQSLTLHFSGAFGSLALASQRRTWQVARTYAPMPIKPRLVLIGDAAHTIHPLAGQGYNLAIGDAMALGRLVAATRQDGGDPGAWHGLKRYAQSRFIETAAMTLATEALNGVFSSSGGLSQSVAQSIFRGGMRLLNAPPLKKYTQKCTQKIANSGLTTHRPL